jgi:integrase/recombinase XerD
MSTRSDAKIIDQWLQAQASPLTRSCYRRDVERLLFHCRKSLARLTLSDLQSFSDSLTAAGLAPVSCARTIAAVKSLFDFCQRMRYLPVNAAAELPLPRYEIRLAERVLSEEDVRRLLFSDAQPRDRSLLNLLYFAGLRVSEACNLRWRNLHSRADAGQVTVFGKNGRTRAISLPAPVWSDLASLRAAADPEDPVFPSRSGRPLDRGRVRTILRQVARCAGIEAPASPHWLRHAHASHALDHGAPIHLVQATLGHSSVATTSAYLHARPGDSSARFLAETFLPKSGKSALPLQHTGVMDVMTAAAAAKGDSIMTSNAEEQATTPATAAAPELKASTRNLKATKKADAAPRAPRVAPGKGKASKKASPAKTVPKRAKATKPAKAETGPRKGSKTETIMALLKRPDGATLKEIMKVTGWQAHSVRGFVSGTLTKKMDLPVASFKNEAGERAYRIEK